eukprot:CAMPEP_0174349450 /NCGR_PEP_ID=MMETSP0811_2-20130205/6183_1 /TAXON_ID=73025 ORGANISM="Eutreptiella gymnastica-like, Strain CCMP1594" /NCGR_SAMPLE_ID=MMETSP0811_2 /ASSEMBLY_ACC=CAM_ASM_000667 /LENGTH=186 /DNA_ID=CAMNT_0015476837 /DNA_START=529 /DNA_END=1088 /DNA_ORIENTATION=+
MLGAQLKAQTAEHFGVPVDLQILKYNMGTHAQDGGKEKSYSPLACRERACGGMSNAHQHGQNHTRNRQAQEHRHQHHGQPRSSSGKQLTSTGSVAVQWDRLLTPGMQSPLTRAAAGKPPPDAARATRRQTAKGTLQCQLTTVESPQNTARSRPAARGKGGQWRAGTDATSLVCMSFPAGHSVAPHP